MKKQAKIRSKNLAWHEREKSSLAWEFWLCILGVVFPLPAQAENLGHVRFLGGVRTPTRPPKIGQNLQTAEKSQG